MHPARDPKGLAALVPYKGFVLKRTGQQVDAIFVKVEARCVDGFCKVLLFLLGVSNMERRQEQNAGVRERSNEILVSSNVEFINTSQISKSHFIATLSPVKQNI